MTFVLSSLSDPAYDHISIPSLHDPCGNSSLYNTFKEPYQSELLGFYRFNIVYDGYKVSGRMTAYSKEHALRVVQDFVKDKARIQNIPEDIKITIIKDDVEYYINGNSIMILDKDT